MVRGVNFWLLTFLGVLGGSLYYTIYGNRKTQEIIVADVSKYQGNLFIIKDSNGNKYVIDLDDYVEDPLDILVPGLLVNIETRGISVQSLGVYSIIVKVWEKR